METESVPEFTINKREQKKLIDFFPEGCTFYWNGIGPPPEYTLLIFNLHKKNNGYCAGCGRDFCPVKNKVKPKEVKKIHEKRKND